MAPWGERLAGVRGVLLDISGVLYDSGAGGGTAIAGSVEAVARLKGSRLKVRFCTNESQKSRAELVGQLRRLGFDISEGEVTAPAPAACQILKERGLRPYLLIHDGVRSEFDQIDTSNPNCVVIADAGESFSYQNMNNAFQVLMELENPVLMSLGKGRYYKETSGLMLDVGPYMKALEYACGIKAEVVGKPSPEFFKSALQAIGVEAHQAVMIGDDIVGDVGGAQRCGMRALQVRTGKFRATQQMLQGACSGPGAHTCSSPKTLPEARSPGAAREITQVQTMSMENTTARRAKSHHQSLLQPWSPQA
ncbi:phospholysine phosphohistidine inorganic pyrophosphate phosphatase isoform X2 [Papio anubis]|uniref:phospholysine phosphohistidine inorganic pyrophosphate phosphatase isoform X2 n=1 Tax=Papio anubis TaxID=9555 RepID=UPI0004F20F5E|nr:phospholysine phosphohistidine inorganic pyrophosphate phosphatase isoform X2 [Papio anubis]